jgi:hypothetical protein
MDIACSYCQIPINAKKDTWFYIHEPGKPDTSAHQRCYDENRPVRPSMGAPPASRYKV